MDISNKVIIEYSLLGNENIKIGDNERITYVFFTDENTDIECSLEFVLGGADSSVKVIGFNLGNKGTSSIAIRVIHRNRNTVGRTWVKSILGGKAKSGIKGMIKIEDDAPLTNGYFTHNSLLLSKEAKVMTSPSLEIETNEVKASHAATTGHLDDGVIFYLNCRGIGGDEAKKLVITSFAHEYLGEIEDPTAREKVGIFLDQKIEKFL